MSIVGDIKNLYSDVEKTRALFPTTKIEAVSDEDGTGLNVILDKMAYVGHGADQVKNLYADKTETQAIFPTTKVKAVSDENGRSLDVLLDDKASKGFVTAKIAEAQLGGGGGSDGADGFSPIATVVPTEDGAIITITDKNGTTMATVKNGADGPKGDKGDTGETGAAGKDGAAGQNGKDGVSATHSWNGTTLTVTSASGTSSADLKGTRGDDGISPTVAVSKVGGTTSIIVTDKNGTKTSLVEDGKDGTNGKDGKSAYEYAKESGYAGDERQFSIKLASESEGFETVAYGVSNGHIIIENMAMNGRPVYCMLTDENLTPYFLPLMEWNLDTHTAFFGGCYANKIISVVCAAGDWSKSENTISGGAGGESNVFIGTEQTPLAEYKTAFDSGKACFILRDRGSSKVMYAVCQVSSSVVHLSRTTSSGLVEYGSLTSSGTLSLQAMSYATEITATNTSANNYVPTAKAVKAAIDANERTLKNWVQNGYAQMDDLPTVPEDIGAQPAGDYLMSSTLPSAINTALAQAKASGEFDGKDGANGVSVSSIKQTTTSTADGGSNVVTVTLSNGTTSTFTVKNGSKGSAGTNGTNGKDGKTPVKGTDYWTEADKAEMVEDVKASMDGIPSYWQTALDNGVEAINTALCEAGRNKSAFLFYSDAHWNYGSQMSPTLLKYLHKHTGMTKTFFGGDIVNNEADDYDTMKYLWEWRKQLKDLPNHHSVVGNHDDGNSTNNLFSEQYVYGYLLAAEETPGMVMGDGLYYYVDSPAEKTRYLCLDTAYKGVDSTQQNFVKDALLTTPSGWHIVAVSHIWHDTNYNTNPPTVGGINSGASTLLAMFEAYNSRNGEYADCAGWVEFCIGGHTHWDYDSTSTMGIPIILVETDSKHTRSGLTFTAGTTTEASVNGIIADYNAKTIKVVRIGRGASREVEMTWFEVSYTNVLASSLAADGVSIYNANGTPGYKANTRWSQSSQVDQDRDGQYITGWIPVKKSDVVYLKNMSVTSENLTFLKSSAPGSTTGSAGFDNLVSGWNGIVDDSENLIQFTIMEDIPYFRIQCGGIDATSIITINEPID